MRQIVIYPDPILRMKTPVIDRVDGELSKDVGDLKEVLLAAQNGAGLAAVQIGLNRRFFGVKESESKKIDVYINPQMVKTYGEKMYLKLIDKDQKEQDFLEGCLSFPDLYGTVRRFFKIDVVWQEIDGERLIKKEKTLKAFEAVVFQHELDHLNGILFTDHIKKDGGKLYRQVGEKMENCEMTNVQ